MTFLTNIANILAKYWQVFLIQGIGYTLLLSVIAVAGGAFFGSLLALAKRSKLKILKALAAILVEVVRGTPVLLQLYIGVFVFPMIIPKLSSLPYIYSVSIVLIINSSAYVSEIIRAVFGWDGLGTVTNASYGVSNIPPFSSVFECVGICAVCIAVMALLIRSSYGRAFKAVRDDDVAAEAMGINLFRTKQLSFVVSSAFAGVAGGLLAAFMRSAVTSTFTVALTYNILLMVVLGGVGSVSGSLIGAFLVTGSQEWLRFLDKEYSFSDLIPGLAGTSFGSVQVPFLRNGFRMVIFSILLMVVVLFWNHGITGSKELTWDRIFGFFRRGKHKTSQEGVGQ